MKTILVLAQNPELPRTIRTILESEPHRLIHRPDIEEAEPLLKHGALDACLLDADQPQVQALWVIERLQEFSPTLPVFVLTATRTPEWEEQLYTRGVAQVLSKPIRPRLLSTLINRLGSRNTSTPASSPASPPTPLPTAYEIASSPEPSRSGDSDRLLAAFEEAVALTPVTLATSDLFDAVLPKLRKVLGVRRAAVFLRWAASRDPGQPPLEESRRLHLVSAVGVSRDVIREFALSVDSGCGAAIVSGASVLTRWDRRVALQPDCLRELNVLGMDTLIALMRDDVLVGVLALGSTVDQVLLPPAVLRDLYFLAEPLAAAVERIWAHERVVANHGMMTDILRELTSACVVVGKDLRILHANASATMLFMDPADGAAELAFSDLPEDLASRIYQVLKAGAPMSPFRYRFQDKLNRQFLASVIPFQSKEALLPASALLVLEDRTQSEQLKRLEVEAANLRLVRTMADRLAHEIGNALVPISTHQQLLPTRHKDPEFRVSLENALASGVKRIGRLVNQMVFLAHDHPMSMESLPLASLIEESFKEAQRHMPIQTATLRQSNESASSVVIGDRPALRHALAEVFINAMQANPADAKVAVRTLEQEAEDGVRWMQIEILDNGDGFVTDTSTQVTEPFFTTRSVGLGLGLTVARKVAEAHQGRLEIHSSEGGRGGCISLYLPLNPSVAH